jgi:hypothetical protein
MSLAGESVTAVTPLGVRFRDPHTGRPVRDLLVTYAGPDGRTVHAPANGRGVFLVHRPRGLREALRGHGDAAYWRAPPERASLRLTLADPRGRYVGYECTLDAPARWLHPAPCGSPPEPADALPLFTAPSGAPPPGLGIVRAELVDDTGAPAGGAMLEASAGPGAVATSLADERGRVLVAVPLPPAPLALGSPPGPRRLADLTWNISLRAWWTPGAAPDLCALLAQRPATLLGRSSPPTPLGPQPLGYGRELVAHTEGDGVLRLIPTAP